MHLRTIYVSISPDIIAARDACWDPSRAPTWLGIESGRYWSPSNVAERDLGSPGEGGLRIYIFTFRADLVDGGHWKTEWCRYFSYNYSWFLFLDFQAVYEIRILHLLHIIFRSWNFYVQTKFSKYQLPGILYSTFAHVLRLHSVYDQFTLSNSLVLCP